MIISGDRILSVPVRTDHNRENPATGYDHCITAATFLPFSGVFPRVPAGNPGNRGPESLSWVEKNAFYPGRIFRLPDPAGKHRKSLKHESSIPGGNYPDFFWWIPVLYDRNRSFLGRAVRSGYPMRMRVLAIYDETFVNHTYYVMS